jgi:hypothetical protein
VRVKLLEKPQAEDLKERVLLKVIFFRPKALKEKEN